MGRGGSFDYRSPSRLDICNYTLECINKTQHYLSFFHMFVLQFTVGTGLSRSAYACLIDIFSSIDVRIKDLKDLQDGGHRSPWYTPCCQFCKPISITLVGETWAPP